MEDSSADDAVPGGERAGFLTVEETAAVLRIGRTAAYEATRRYRSERRARYLMCSAHRLPGSGGPTPMGWSGTIAWSP